MARRPNTKIENQSQNQQADIFALPEEFSRPLREFISKATHLLMRFYYPIVSASLHFGR